MRLITYKSWEIIVKELGGEVWEIGKPLPNSPFVFCGVEHFDILFRQILESEQDIQPFTLISAASDAGPCIAREHLPFQDIRKWVQMDPNIEVSLGYHDYICRARCDKSRCLRSDRYSNRMYSWTSSTFPTIPKCVSHWYCTNCNIEDERITPIPFGINPDSTDILQLLCNQYYKGSKECDNYRENKVVASWSNSTNERAYIKQSLDKSVFLTDKVEPQEFFRRLLTSKLCLCPVGNGLDSYRILEALYCGCIPIIVVNESNITWTKAYQKICNIPVCNNSEINYCVQSLINSNFQIDCTDFLYLDSWKDLINGRTQ